MKIIIVCRSFGISKSNQSLTSHVNLVYFSLHAIPAAQQASQQDENTKMFFNSEMPSGLFIHTVYIYIYTLIYTIYNTAGVLHATFIFYLPHAVNLRNGNECAMPKNHRSDLISIDAISANDLIHSFQFFYSRIFFIYFSNFCFSHLFFYFFYPLSKFFFLP